MEESVAYHPSKFYQISPLSSTTYHRIEIVLTRFRIFDVGWSSSRPRAHTHELLFLCVCVCVYNNMLVHLQTLKSFRVFYTMHVFVCVLSSSILIKLTCSCLCVSCRCERDVTLVPRPPQPHLALRQEVFQQPDQWQWRHGGWWQRRRRQASGGDGCDQPE